MPATLRGPDGGAATGGVREWLRAETGVRDGLTLASIGTESATLVTAADGLPGVRSPMGHVFLCTSDCHQLFDRVVSLVFTFTRGVFVMSGMNRDAATQQPVQLIQVDRANNGPGFFFSSEGHSDGPDGVSLVNGREKKRRMPRVRGDWHRCGRSPMGRHPKAAGQHTRGRACAFPLHHHRMPVWSSPSWCRPRERLRVAHCCAARPGHITRVCVMCARQHPAPRGPWSRSVGTRPSSRTAR